MGRIQKGEVRNPTGRNGKKPVSDALRVFLTRNIEDATVDKPKTVAQQIAYNLIQDALFANERMPATKEIIDRVEGKPSQAIVGDNDYDPITIVGAMDKKILERYGIK